MYAYVPSIQFTQNVKNKTAVNNKTAPCVQAVRGARVIYSIRLFFYLDPQQIELRGIGIIDVKMLFGVSSVRESQSIDLVIQLEEWDKEKEYDRMGLEEDYIEYLGKQVVCHRIPIRPGRNLAVICEAAAANDRQKLMGYNAALELYRRVQNRMLNKGRDNG